MRDSRPATVLVYHRRAAEYRRLLEARLPEAEVLAVTPDEPLEAHVGAAEVLLAWRFPLEALEAAGRLRWIQLTAAGVEHLVAARDRLRHLVVTNARGIHGDLMADYAAGVLVLLHWGFPRLFRHQQARRWVPQATAPLAGMTLGLVGLGAIGQAIARRAAAFGLEVLGVRRGSGPVPGVSQVFGPGDLRAVLPRCDFVVLAVPETAETRGMMGEAELRRMKPGAYLVNLARGAVVDEAALLRALRERWIAGAALDVFAQEPLPPDHPLWTLDNVVVTPHIAGEPADYLERLTALFVDNYRRFAAGESLRNVVDLDRGY